MRLQRYIAGLTLLVCTSSVLAQAISGSAAAGATTYKCIDSTGRSTYTNVNEDLGGKKCTVVSREVSVVPVAPPAPARQGTQTDAGKGVARVDAQTQRSRDDQRRFILQRELQDAEKQLVEARKKLAEQEAIRGGDERNYQRVLDRLKPYQDEVRVAEDNVAAVKRELANAR